MSYINKKLMMIKIKKIFKNIVLRHIQISNRLKMLNPLWILYTIKIKKIICRFYLINNNLQKSTRII